MSKTVYVVKKQSGFRKSIVRDRQRSAMLPGKRISANNRYYWETRKNRSDRRKSRI